MALFVGHRYAPGGPGIGGGGIGQDPGQGGIDRAEPTGFAGPFGQAEQRGEGDGQVDPGGDPGDGTSVARAPSVGTALAQKAFVPTAVPTAFARAVVARAPIVRVEAARDARAACARGPCACAACACAALVGAGARAALGWLACTRGAREFRPGRRVAGVPSPLRMGADAQGEVEEGAGPELIQGAVQAGCSQLFGVGGDALVGGQCFGGREVPAAQGGGAGVFAPQLHPGVALGPFPPGLRGGRVDRGHGAGDRRAQLPGGLAGYLAQR